MKYTKVTATEPAAQLLRRVKLEMSEAVGGPVTQSVALQEVCSYWLAVYHAGQPGQLPPRPGGKDGSGG